MVWVEVRTDIVQQRLPNVVETWTPPYDMRDVRVECTTMSAGVAVMMSGLGCKRAVPRGTLLQHAKKASLVFRFGLPGSVGGTRVDLLKVGIHLTLAGGGPGASSGSYLH